MYISGVHHHAQAETNRPMSKWFEEKEKKEQAALQNHARLSRLFKEDRFAFERERRRMIEEVIDSAPDEERKCRLRALQDDWDRKMKSAGSAHNRFVLAQTFFWDHFHEVWNPAIRTLNSALNDKPPYRGPRLVSP